MSDSNGGIYDEHGLDAEALQACKRETGSVSNYSSGDRLSNEALLTLPCDILVPAALENQLTERIAPKVQSKLIAEAANGPTTPAADAIFQDRGVTVVPDILANAGGSRSPTSSGFRICRNFTGRRSRSINNSGT